MKIRVPIAAAVLLLSAHVFAAVGVAIGHHTWAEDGIPVIGPNEQVAVFTCTGKMTGPSAMSCAVDKCLAHFKLPKSSEITNIANTVLVGGKCSPQGRSDDRGHSLVVAGPRGDNRFIFSRALGSATREEAVAVVRAEGFPLEKGRIVLDYFDKDGTLPPLPVSQPAALNGPGSASSAYRAFFDAVTSKRDPLALERARVAVRVAQGDNAIFESCLAGNSSLISCVQSTIARSRMNLDAATRLGYHLAAATDPYRFTENPGEAAKALIAIGKRLSLNPKAPDYIQWPGDDELAAQEFAAIALRSWVMDACSMLAMPHADPKAARPVVFGFPIEPGPHGHARCIAAAAVETIDVLDFALLKAERADYQLLPAIYERLSDLAGEVDERKHQSKVR